MGKDLYDRSPAAKQVFLEANEALGMTWPPSASRGRKKT